MWVKIYLLFLLINGSLGIMSGYATDLGQTNIAGNITSTDTPLIFNDTDSNTLIGNLTGITNSTIGGHTGDDNPLDFITDGAAYLLFPAQIAFNFLTMGFVFDAMDSFTGSIGVTFPEEAILLFKAIFGISFAFFVIYLITGRSFTSFV